MLPFLTTMKNPLRRALLAVVLFTILFALLMVAAAYFWTHDSMRIAIICFIAAFFSMMCQIGCLMLFIRYKQMHMMAKQQRNQNHVQ